MRSSKSLLILFSFLLQQNNFGQSPSNFLSLGHAEHFRWHNISYDLDINKAIELYDAFIQQASRKKELQTIPKIIHQVWIGSPYPEEYRQLRDTWLERHPEWEYKLWTDNDIKEFKLTNQELYDAATNYGEKSDIVRYEILYRIGGLYIDTDFECLMPFDTIHNNCDFYTGLNYGPNTYAFIGIIGSRPGHPILKTCINELKGPEKILDRNNSDEKIMQRTGPDYFTQCIKKTLENTPSDTLGTTVLFPAKYFYPWPCFKKQQNKREQIEQWIVPDITFAIHHWHVSWLK